MPEQISNAEQLLQDYARQRDALVKEIERKHTLNPDRLLAAVREDKEAALRGHGHWTEKKKTPWRRWCDALRKVLGKF